MLLMKKGKGTFGKKYITHSTLPDKKLLLLGGLFLMGVLCGALSLGYVDGDTASILKNAVKHYIFSRPQMSSGQLFFHLMLPDTLLLFAIFLCGYCAVAAPVLLLFPFFKGLGFGFFASLILTEYQMKSVKLIIGTLFPTTLWSIFLLIFACRDAGKLSYAFYEASKREGTPIHSGRFCAVMLLYWMLLAVGYASQTIFFGKFGSLFLPEF